jgi:hypothetical protein
MPQATKLKHTLSYVRPANKRKDGYDGFLYLHRWPTGYQFLVFNTKKQAEFAETNLNKKTD